MKFRMKVTGIFDSIMSSLYVLAGVLVIFVMLAVSFDVTMRYFLGNPQGWVLTITEVMLLYITFLGTAWLLKRYGPFPWPILQYLQDPQRAHAEDNEVSFFSQKSGKIFIASSQLLSS